MGHYVAEKPTILSYDFENSALSGIVTTSAMIHPRVGGEAAMDVPGPVVACLKVTA